MILMALSAVSMALALSGCSLISPTNQSEAYRGIASGPELAKLSPASQTYENTAPPVKAKQTSQSAISTSPTTLAGTASEVTPSVSLGTRTPCGLVIDIRGPLAKVQIGSTSHWVLIHQLLAARNIEQCP